LTAWIAERTIAPPAMEHAPAAASADGDADLLDRLRAGEADAFRTLLRRHHRAVVRVVGAIVRREAIAEEVAQEAWLSVVRHLHAFDGRGTLKGWIFRIAINAAKARAPREAREVPASSLGGDDDESEGGGEATVDPARFNEEGRWVGHWSAPPVPWPDAQLRGAETRALIEQAFDELPPLIRRCRGRNPTSGCSPPRRTR
jgi:RNA polymerase sigma-70 factor (ECF subfamily)